MPESCAKQAEQPLQHDDKPQNCADAPEASIHAIRHLNLINISEQKERLGQKTKSEGRWRDKIQLEGF